MTTIYHINTIKVRIMESKTDDSIFNLDSIISSTAAKGGGEINYKPKRKIASNEHNYQSGITHSSNPENFSHMLKGYAEISLNSIGSLKPDEFIKYVNTEGSLKHSGKIKLITPEGDGSYTILLTSYNGKRGIRWSINSKKISRLYRHLGAPVNRDTVPKNKVISLGGDDEDETMSMKNKINSLEIRIQTLERSLKTVINVLNGYGDKYSSHTSHNSHNSNNNIDTLP